MKGIDRTRSFGNSVQDQDYAGLPFAPLVGQPLTVAPPQVKGQTTPDYWAVQANGDWSDGADWSTGAKPTSANDVTLSTAGTYTVTHSTGTDTINSLTTTTDTLSLTGGTLAVLNAASLGAALSITGGLLTLDGPSTASAAASVSGNATLAIGTGADFTATGPVNFGDIHGSDGAIVGGPGTLTTAGTTTIQDYANDDYRELWLGGGATWTNTGTVDDSGAISFGFYNNGKADSASIVNAAGAVFDLLKNDASFTDAYNAAGYQYTVSNAGTFEKTAGTATNTINAVFNNTGVIDVATSTIELDAGGSLAGTLLGTGTLGLGRGTFTLAGGLAGSGSLAIYGSSLLTISGSGTLSPNATLNGGATLTLGTDDVLTASGALSIGDHSGADEGIVGGPGTLATTGTTTIEDYTSAGYTEMTLGGGVTWTNSGTVNDAGVISMGFYNNGKLDTLSIVNQAGANFNLLDDDGSLLNNYENGKYSYTFSNAGTLAKTGGAGVSNFYATLTTTGVIDVASGTLELDGGGSLGGTLTGTGTLALGHGTYTSTASVVSGTGNLAIYGASTALTITATGTLQAAVSISNGGVLDVTAGNILTLAGTNVFGSKSQSDGQIAGPGTLVTSGPTAIVDSQSSGALELRIYDQAGLTNSGTLTDAGLVGVGNGDITKNADTLANAAGAIFDLTSDDAGITAETTGTFLFSNAGTLAKISGNGTSTIGIALATSGLVDASAGTLQFTGGGTLGGTIGAVGASAVLLGGNTTYTAAGTLTITDNGSSSALNLATGSTFKNTGVVIDLGTETLGNNASGTATFVNIAGASFDLADDDADIATKGTVSLTNSGLIAKTSGTATSTISGALTNSGTLEAGSGTLTVSGALSGTGLIDIAAGATFEAGMALPAKQTIDFTGAYGAMLKLDKPASITGTMTGFGGGNRLYLTGVDATGVSILGSTLTVASGSTKYNFVSSASLATDAAVLTSANGTDAIVSLYREAVPGGHTPEPVAFGNHHVGDTASIALSVGNTALADGYSEALDAYVASNASFYSVNGSVTGLAAGLTSNAITFSLNTSSAGTFTTTTPLSLDSDGAGIDGRGQTPLAPQTITVTGAVYAYAAPTLASTSIDLGVVHVGDTTGISQALDLTNSAAPGYSEALDAMFVSTSGAITANGTITGLGASDNDDTSLVVGLVTSASGSISGTAQLELVSDGTGIDGLGTTILGTQAIEVTGTVDNYAQAAFQDSTGQSITGSGTQFSLNLGTVGVGGSPIVADIGALNSATGLADLLGGTISTTGGTGFTNSGFGTFSGLGAGQGEHSQVVTLSTSTAGTFSETVVLTGSGSNASGYVGPSMTDTLTITGTVVGGTTTYILAPGPNIIVGANGGADIFQAADGTLNSHDQLTGGSGANTLTLVGAGTFDVGAPTVFNNIPTIIASEGQAASSKAAATNQIVLLRPGTAETVDVLSGKAATGNSNVETIAIYGSANSDVINLASGHDLVVLGGAGESVNGGGGTALVQATSVFAGAQVIGGTGSTTLEITTGGTAALNAADTQLTVKLDAATNLSLSSMSFVTADGSSGSDTITAGSVGQTLTGGGGTDLLVGYTGGSDTFLDTAADLSTTTIANWTDGDKLDLTNVTSTKLKALKFSNGTLTVTDGTHTATISFTGSVGLSNFTVVGSDGHTGTVIGWHS